MSKSKPRKARVPQKPPGRCIFCQESGNMTKQHIWPDWMGRDETLPTWRGHDRGGNTQIVTKFSNLSPNLRIPLIQMDAPDVTNKQGHVGSRKVRLVCNKCNGGWMAEIEQASQPILTKLLKNEDCIISHEEQLKLATWITQMAIVVEFTDIPHKATSYAERKYFMDNKTTPDSWVIWIAKYDGKQWEQRYKHGGAALVALDGLPIPAKKDALPNFQASLIAAGSLFIYAMSTSLPRAKKNIDEFTHPKMTKLWPTSGSPISWTDLPRIGDDVANSLRLIFPV
jgi:hypothetical protein